MLCLWLCDVFLCVEILKSLLMQVNELNFSLCIKVSLLFFIALTLWLADKKDICPMKSPSPPITNLVTTCLTQELWLFNTGCPLNLNSMLRAPWCGQSQYSLSRLWLLNSINRSSEANFVNFYLRHLANGEGIVVVSVCVCVCLSLCQPRLHAAMLH